MMIERKQSPFLVEPLFHEVLVSVCLPICLSHRRTQSQTHTDTHTLHPCLADATCRPQPRVMMCIDTLGCAALLGPGTPSAACCLGFSS